MPIQCWSDDNVTAVDVSGFGGPNDGSRRKERWQSHSGSRRRGAAIQEILQDLGRHKPEECGECPGLGSIVARPKPQHGDSTYVHLGVNALMPVYDAEPYLLVRKLLEGEDVEAIRLTAKVSRRTLYLWLERF